MKNIGTAYILYIDSDKSREYMKACVESCKQNDVDNVPFLGYSGLTIEELAEKTGWKIGREGMEENDRQYVKEYNAALGHIEIWRKIVESEEAGVVLEHDTVVKGCLHELIVEDGEILHLGPRIDDASLYEVPKDLAVKYLPIRRHEGAHAYAMTPATAKFLLDKIEEEKRLLPTEALISVRNRYGLSFKETDPPYVVCDMGDRVSYTHHSGVTDKYNFKHHPGFLAGLKSDRAIEQYKLMDYRFTEDWFSANIENWQTVFALTDKVAGEPLKILEIGCFEGRATTWIADNLLSHEESEIFCIDTFAGSHEHSQKQVASLEDTFRHNVSVCSSPEKVKTLKGDSRFILPAMARQGMQFDIIYVDGSHATLDVVQDGIYAMHLLRSDGVIIFDDYQWTDPVVGNQPVKKAVDFLDANYPKFMKRVLDGYQRAYHKAP